MNYTVKPVAISLRSRILCKVIGFFIRGWMSWVMRGSNERLAKAQALVASQPCRNSFGLPLEYRVVGRVPGYVVGNLHDADQTAILYLHGGAFILPASPIAHVTMLARWCRDLNAVGFLPDYRLAPANQFPAGLDDCERAYEALLDRGYNPKRIVIAGESAGGNLTLTLLQRIRKRGWPMPVCAVPISPATEMGRLHAPPSRTANRRKDVLLPLSVLYRIDELYLGDWDSSDPELSPLFADFTDFPPLYVLASNAEILTDDAVLFAQAAREAGVPVKLDIWSALPHAFPLFEPILPEAKQARLDIYEFIRAELDRREV